MSYIMHIFEELYLSQPGLLHVQVMQSTDKVLIRSRRVSDTHCLRDTPAYLQLLFDWVRATVIQNIHCQLLWRVVDVQGTLHHRAIERPGLLVSWQVDVNLKQGIHLVGSVPSYFVNLKALLT